MSSIPTIFPDGAMCCICFEWVPVEECWQDTEGQKWDMCGPCGERERGAE